MPLLIIHWIAAEIKLLFLNEGSSSALDEDFAADSESTTTSTAQKSKSSSPDEVEIIGAIPRESKERTRRYLTIFRSFY